VCVFFSVFIFFELKKNADLVVRGAVLVNSTQLPIEIQLIGEGAPSFEKLE
jgi:hypothetical protein